MAAKLATAEEIISAVGGGIIIPGDARGNSRIDRIQFDCGYLSPYFVTDPERMEVVFEKVYILVHAKKISAKEDLLPLLEQITKTGKPLLIIAKDVGSGALATLVVNNLSGPLQVAAVRAPWLGDQRNGLLRDIALLIGGRAITESRDVPLKDIQISDLGLAKKVIIDRNRTVIEGNARYSQLSFEPGAQRLLPAYPLPALLSS